MNKVEGDLTLTERQSRLMTTVEMADKDNFVRLGGATGADLNFEVTRDGAFPLLVACARGDLEFVNLMLSNMQIEVNKKDKNGVNAYFMAAYHGNVSIMRRLMEKGADIFQKNSNGSNVLHIAAKRGNTDVINELIRIKYPLNDPKINGITALGIAAMKGNLKVVSQLHNNGADLNKTSPAGIGPLYLAIKAGHNEMVRYLIEGGADIYFRDPIKVDYSPVFMALKIEQVAYLEMMCDAIDRGQMDQFLDSQGYTPLMIASKNGMHDVVNYLSLRGSDLN